MNKWDSVRAIAVATTPIGVVVNTEDGMRAMAYGNFIKGDVLLVFFYKAFD